MLTTEWVHREDVRLGDKLVRGANNIHEFVLKSKNYHSNPDHYPAEEVVTITSFVSRAGTRSGPRFKTTGYRFQGGSQYYLRLRAQYANEDSARKLREYLQKLAGL